MGKYFFPGVMFFSSLGACAWYALGEGDWRRAGYWISAAAITFFVTV
jgi:hypothetical protein